MGVSKTVKKMPKRVKKAIRKTLSGICMVSAIIVALVPAEVSEGYTKIEGQYLTDHNYNYGVSGNGDDFTTTSTVQLDKYKNNHSIATNKTYYVRETQGNYEYGWQFLTYPETVNGTTMGVICDYNSSYSTNLLEINKYLATEYLTVPESEYNAFYQIFVDARNNQQAQTVDYGTGTQYKYDARYEISYPNHVPGNTIVDNTPEYYFKKYFPDKYNTAINDYNAWKTKYDNYQAYKAWEAASNNNPTPPNSQSTDPGSFETYVYVADMSNANNNALFREYFCEVNKDYNTVNYQLGGYILVQAYDYTVSAVGNNTPVVYLCKGEPNLDYETGGTGSTTNSKNDSLGFYVKSKTGIIAIGDNAFQNVVNVDSMNLAGDIAYIGDEAFLDSYVKSITFSNVSEIGNRAFKNCSQLASVTLGSGTTIIGTEAFYGCSSLGTVTFPYSVKKIYPGAFAECSMLTVADLSEIGQANAEVGAFAFFNDVALNQVTFSDKITTLGDAAFACTAGATGSLTTFDMPKNLNSLGDFLLAGRGNLQTVNMPVNWGRTQSPSVTLPEHFLWNCYNLHALVFPDDGAGSCGYIDFKNCSTIFSTITYDDFYVQGPEKNAALTNASPRTSTWGKISGAGNQVPYVYIDSNGERQFEISDGKYILVVDNNGTLTSISFDPSQTLTNITMTIPEKVGNTPVKAISSSCFDNATLKNEMVELIIEDNTISEIASSAFKDYTKLKKVTIGNSVTKIGSSAFEGCTSLTDIIFHAPSGGSSSFPLENIGDKALSTGSSKLTITGIIDENYGPYKWAMDTNNYVDETTGLRVCYKTGAPYYLTVIVDNRNGLPTLVDYPHYDQLNALSNTEGSKVSVSDNSGNTIVIETDLVSKYENIVAGMTEVTDSATNEVLYSYYLTTAEEALVNATLHLDVPAGVKSIDVKGFMNNTSVVKDGYSATAKNNQSVSAYLVAIDGVANPNYATYKDKGLFNGFYGTVTGAVGKREFPTSGPTAGYEEIDQGNDRIESVTMHTVEYLPDNAFYSCEQLESVILGASMGDLGNAPFAGCDKMTSVGSSSADVVCNNGIIYSVNDDGTYNIVEVLSSRGISVGSKKIKAGDEDPYLANVSTISDGAFKNCAGITAVDLTGMVMVTEVPDECFMNCKSLSQVVLPENIKSIGKNAFAGCMEGIELVIYGQEVYMSPSTFGTSLAGDEYDEVKSKRVISYKDSAARKAAAALGADVSETLDDTVKVQFFDYDGTELSKLIYVTYGESIALENIPDDPVRDGYTFAGWNKSLKNITADSVIVATYTQNSSNSSTTDSGSTSTTTSTSGSTSTSTSTSGTTSATTFYTLTVTNGNGSGSYAEGATVIITCTDPPAGKVFDKWVPTTTDLGIASVNVAATTLKMPAHEASVTATFKNAPTGTSGSSSTSGNNSSSNNGSTTNKNNGNTIVISKNGISNTSLASAQVIGSSDNYVIRIAETAAATAAVEKALTNEYGSLDNIRYTAMDITLYDATGTNKITNYSGLSVTITLPIPDVMTAYAGNNKVAGVVNEKLDKLSPKFTTIDGVPCVTFTATHFSPYTIYVDTQNMTAAGTSDESPKTGDGIQPKWFLVAGLVALSIALFFMKDRKPVNINSIA